MPTTLEVVLQSIRPPFLVLSPVCLFLGVSTATASGATVSGHLIAAVLLCGIAAHAAVNALNEYEDFKSGLDLNTVRTPFSGGSGALPSHPELAGAVRLAGLLLLAFTALIVVYFVLLRGPFLLGVGGLGIVLIVSYTKWINRSPLLCLIAPGIAFGPLMVVGAHYALIGTHAFLPWVAALVPFFLVNSLLLLNQYPDIQADSEAGRNHLLIAFGIAAGNVVYGLFALLTGLAILAPIMAGLLPGTALIALAPLGFSLFALRGAVRCGGEIGHHPRYLAANVAATLLTPLLLGLAIIHG